MLHAGTFSIVACDEEQGELGVAVQSKFLAVGAAVPWAEAKVGAIATQAYMNTSYGPMGLRLLKAGLHPQEVLDRLVSSDPGRELRQIGVVDFHERSASFTGSRCPRWAGHETGAGFACQGNTLVGADTVKAMIEAFREQQGSLALRLLAALGAGQLAGGDRRGKQAAALLIVKEHGGYGGFSDRYIDLRVDDHPEPIEELVRLHRLHRFYFSPASDEDLVQQDTQVISTIQAALCQLDYYEGPQDGRWSSELERALFDFCGTENLEEHLRSDGLFDRRILGHMDALLRSKQPNCRG